MNYKKHIRRILNACDSYALRKDTIRVELETAIRGKNVGDVEFEQTLQALLDSGDIGRRQDRDTHDWLYFITEQGKTVEAQ